MIIENVHAREILDSRGNPTVETVPRPSLIWVPMPSSVFLWLWLMLLLSIFTSHCIATLAVAILTPFLFL